MPRKGTKEIAILSIRSRMMRHFEGLSASDPDMELTLAVLRWDKQRTIVEHGSVGPVNLERYDRLLGGVIERRLFREERILSRAGDLVDRVARGDSDDVDILELLKALTPDRLDEFIAEVGKRLLKRLYRLQGDVVGDDDQDPIDLVFALKKLTNEELKNLDEALARLAPTRSRGRPRRNSIARVDYGSMEYWRRVTEMFADLGSLRAACIAVSAEDGDRDSPPEDLLRRYRGLDKLIRATLTADSPP